MSMFRTFRMGYAISVMLLLCFGCGYKFSGGGSLPGGVERVAVGIFKNNSAETGVEGIVGNDIIYEFTRNGKTFSYDRNAADAVLSGTVVSVVTQPVSRQSVHMTQERRVTMIISLKLVDLEGGVLWEASRISDNEEYEVAEDKGTTEQNKRSAISSLSKRLAEKVYYRMTDNF